MPNDAMQMMRALERFCVAMGRATRPMMSAFDCMIEHHMIEVAFNTFLVFAFANLDPVLGTEKRDDMERGIACCDEGAEHHRDTEFAKLDRLESGDGTSSALLLRTHEDGGDAETES